MLVQIALTLTVLLGFCGLALDVGMLQLKKLQLQNAADAAALGASYSIGNAGAAWDAAKAESALNGFPDDPSHGTTVGQPVKPTTGVYANNSSALQVTIQQNVNPIFFTGAQTLSAQATALAGTATACSYLLSVNSSQPSLSSANTPISSMSNGCSVYLGLPYAISNASSTGPLYLVNGPTVGAVSNGTVYPDAKPNIGTLPDPLTSMPAPLSRGCDYSSNAMLTKNTRFNGNTRFCGGFTISNDSVVFPSAIYTVQGNISITGSSGITGTNVLFYMQPLADGSCGNISITGSTLTLSAQITGAYQGILIYSDRSCPASSAGNGELQMNNVNGNGGSLDGILYLPGQEIYTSNAVLKGNHYFGVVADRINMANGSLSLSSDYSSLQNSSPFPPSGASLVQ